MSTGPYSSPNFRVVASSGTNTGSMITSFPAATTATALGYEIGTTLPQCPMHVTEDSNIEYLDGKVISYCVLCGDRVEIKRLPGGLNMVAARSLAALLAEKAHDDTLTSEDFGDLATLVTAVTEEQEALAEIASLLKMVREALGV